MRYKLMHRTHEDPMPHKAWTNGRKSFSGLTTILDGKRANCERIGCEVRDSIPPLPPGFVAERDGRFYESFEIVEANNG